MEVDVSVAQGLASHCIAASEPRPECREKCEECEDSRTRNSKFKHPGASAASIRAHAQGSANTNGGNWPDGIEDLVQHCLAKHFGRSRQASGVIDSRSMHSVVGGSGVVGVGCQGPCVILCLRAPQAPGSLGDIYVQVSDVKGSELWG